MFSAEIYQSIYVSVMMLLTIIVGGRYSKYSTNRVLSKGREDILSSLVLVVSVLLFIGFRPISEVFPDMAGYANAMLSHDLEGVPVTWDNNYVFTLFMAFLSSNNASPQTPIVLLAAINIFSTFLAVRKMFPNDTMVALLVVFGSFVYFATATNGIKAGCAMGLLLCSLAFRDRIIVSLFFLFLSMGFHHSMQMAIGAYFVCHFYKKSKPYFYVWGFCLLLSLLHVQYFQFLFGGLTDEHGAGYLLSSMEDVGFGGRTGFRWDFLLYCSIPVVVGYYAFFKKKIISERYSFIMNMYLVTDSIWILCMYAPYTNRIAEVPWGLLPIVTIYPFLKEQWSVTQYKTFQKLAYFLVGFTFFMNFIFYAIIRLK